MESLSQCILVVSLFVTLVYGAPEIRRNAAKANRVPEDVKMDHIKPVGSSMAKNFVPLTELPPPKLPLVHYHNGRRHMDDDCAPKPPAEQVYEGGHVAIVGEDYEEKFAKTMATVIFPDHIDRKHFEVTTPAPYFTVGFVEAIGYHASTIQSEHPAECEKIYQDHMAEQYSDESQDVSEESLEMARMPLAGKENMETIIDADAEKMLYDDLGI